MPGTSVGVDVAVVVVLGALLVAALVLLVVLVVQWRRFSRALGAFRCYVRLPDSTGPFSRWRSGVARFDTVDLRWFPMYSLRASRSLVLSRVELELYGRWAASEDDGVPLDLTVLRGCVRSRTVELAVPGSSASALVLWVESGPPGRGVNVA